MHLWVVIGGGPVRGFFYLSLERDIAPMTTPHIIDPAHVLTEALGQASPDLMRVCSRK